MGAINQGGGNTDWGQLGGDSDGLGNLEGSAQNLLDFTGQPPGLFDVKVRATRVGRHIIAHDNLAYDASQVLRTERGNRLSVRLVDTLLRLEVDSTDHVYLLRQAHA